MDIQKFNPTVAELTALAEEAKSVDVSDLTAVKEMRLKLRTARTTITKTGKEFRTEALAFQKAVIAKEKELLELVTPEEDRLKQIEDDAAKAIELEERQKKMPWRKEQIMLIGDGLDNPTDEELLEMDDEQFASYLNDRKVAKFDADEAEKREKEEAERIEKEKAEAVEKARIEEQEKAEKRVQEEKERAEREAKEKEEREKREAEEAERKEKEEQEKAEKNKKYKDWLKKNGYEEADKDSYKIERSGNTFTLYKLVDSITIE